METLDARSGIEAALSRIGPGATETITRSACQEWRGPGYSYDCANGA